MAMKTYYSKIIEGVIYPFLSLPVYRKPVFRYLYRYIFSNPNVDNVIYFSKIKSENINRKPPGVCCQCKTILTPANMTSRTQDGDDKVL